jgi:hypothetical protein
MIQALPHKLSWALLGPYSTRTPPKVIKGTSTAVRQRHSRTTYQGHFWGHMVEALPHNSSRAHFRGCTIQKFLHNLSRALLGPYDSSTPTQLIEGTSRVVRLKHFRTIYQGHFRGHTIQALPHNLSRELPVKSGFKAAHKKCQKLLIALQCKLSCTSYEGNSWCC